MQAYPRHSILIALSRLKIVSDMVANELAIYNATSISFLATKNSGLVAIIATSFLRINNGNLRTSYVLLENHIERSSLLKHST